jgi:hypothetical protein
MGLARNSIRHVVKRELADRTRARLAGVTVDVGWPPEGFDGDGIWVAGVNGTQDTPFIGGDGRANRDDTFTVTVVAQAVAPGGTCQDAEEALARITAALEDVLAEEATLGDLDGLISLGDSVPVDGPDSFQLPEGALAIASFAVDVTARYN